MQCTQQACSTVSHAAQTLRGGPVRVLQGFLEETFRRKGNGMNSTSL